MCFNISSKFEDLRYKWDYVSSGNLRPKEVSLVSESIVDILISLKNVSADSLSLFPEEFKINNIQLLNTLCEGVKKSGFSLDKIEKITSNALKIKKKIEGGPTSRNINEQARIDLKMALFCNIGVPDGNGSIILALMTALRTNVPFVATRSILTGKDIVKKKNLPYVKGLESLLLDKQDQWEIYQYKRTANEVVLNEELIVFIPKTLTSSKSVEFRYGQSFSMISAEKALRKTRHTSNEGLETLIGLFGEIEKSSQGILLYMHGHGESSSTAGLYQHQFERFQDGIKSVCRGLVISSCAASGKVSQVYFPKLVNESKVVQEDDLPWVILESIGDFSSYSGLDAEADLFFFMEQLSLLIQTPGGATITRYKRMLRSVEKGKKKRWSNWNRVLFPHSMNSPVGFQTPCESTKAHPYRYVEEIRKPLEKMIRAKIAMQKRLKVIEGTFQIKEGGIRIYQEWKSLLQNPRSFEDNRSLICRCYNFIRKLSPPPLYDFRFTNVADEEFLLVDPLIVNEPIIFQKSDLTLLSMIPGQSQVFIREIHLSSLSPRNYLVHMLSTYVEERVYVNKGFFIGKLQYSYFYNYKQIVLKSTPEGGEFIYREGGKYYHFCSRNNETNRCIPPLAYFLLFLKWQKSTQCDPTVVKRICGRQQSIEMFNETICSKAFWGEEYETLEKYQALLKCLEKMKLELEYTKKWELKSTTWTDLRNNSTLLRELVKLVIEIDDPEILCDLVESSTINIMVGRSYQEIFSAATNDMKKYSSLVKICLTKMTEDGAIDEYGFVSGKINVSSSLVHELNKDITDWNREFILMLLKFGANIGEYIPQITIPIWAKLIEKGDLDLLKLVIENTSEIYLDNDDRGKLERLIENSGD